jgi:nucleotide-binding universal stress UspA family protein
MKILVPVDGSKHSTGALYTAIDIAKTKKAELYVLTVTPFLAAFDLEVSAADREKIEKSFEKGGEAVINKACDIATGEDMKVYCKAEVSSTSIPDAIIQYAEKEKVDLIVIGSKGLSPASRFRMGSVAAKVVKHSPCSVYVVKI